MLFAYLKHILKLDRLRLRLRGAERSQRRVPYGRCRMADEVRHFLRFRVECTDQASSRKFVNGSRPHMAIFAFQAAIISFLANSLIVNLLFL
jgi:hypothetical protein